MPGLISLRFDGLPEHWKVVELTQALQDANVVELGRVCIEQPGVAMVYVYSWPTAAKCMALKWHTSISIIQVPFFLKLLLP